MLAVIRMKDVVCGKMIFNNFSLKDQAKTKQLEEAFIVLPSMPISLLNLTHNIYTSFNFLLYDLKILTKNQ